MESILLQAPCKINLTLGIRGLLPGGYHCMEMVMQTVSLYDRVRVTLTDNTEICCTCSDGALPTDGRNIAVRAGEAFVKALGRPLGCVIHLEKEIPQQAGLGGGSADGAAVLLALNQLTGRPFTLGELCTLGLTVGADLPFCLTGGTALVTGVGEVAEILPPLPDCCMLLVKPPEGISTSACFAAYDQLPTPPAGDPAQMLSALQAGDLPAIAQGMFNELRLAAGLPAVARLEDRLKQGGALGAGMSGSGSAVCGIFAHEEKAVRLAAQLREEGLWAVLCHPISTGPTILKE